MPQVEMHTITFLVGMLYIVMPAFAWLVLGEARNRAATLWCAGGLVMGVGTILVSAFSGKAFTLLSLSLPSSMLFASYVMRVQALRMDLGKPYSGWTLALVLLAFTATFEYLARVVGLYVPRAMFVSASFCAGASLLVWSAVQIARSEQSQMARWIALVYGIVALGFVLRFVFLSQQDWSRVEGYVVSDGPAGLAVALVLLLASVIGHFGYVGLFLERTQRQAIAKADELARTEVTQQLGAQITVLERRQTVGEMAASIGHELNQPLTAILTNTQLAKRGLQSGRMGSEAVLPLLDKVVLNTQRASQILERIRHFMRAVPVQQELVDLNRVMQDVLDLLEGTVPGLEMRIEVALAPGAVWVKGDALQLSQVVLNLMRNAQESMAGSREPRMRISCQQRNGGAQVLVRDWGTGLNDTQQAQAGTPFFTTKPQGLGMGLTISRSIARNHGGSLRLGNAQDGEGPGALAVLELPQSNSPQEVA